MEPATTPSDPTLSELEYPPKADLLKDVSKPLPAIPPETIGPAFISSDESVTAVKAVLEALNGALASGNLEDLVDCFYAGQTYWRDVVALTSHIRTFSTARVAAAALLHLFGLKGLEGKLELEGSPNFTVVSSTLIFLECQISFRTSSPAQRCLGSLTLLPVRSEKKDGAILWKIWILATWVKELVQYPEDESLLRAPGRNLDDVDMIETDVCILGGGSAGLMTSLRLKALGVDSVILDRNARVGDSWGKRYDSLKLHVPTSMCEMPYIWYGEEFQTPHLLTKDEIAEQIRKFAAEFRINVISSAMVLSTAFRPSEKMWTLTFKTADGSGTRTIRSRHFVQATGFSSVKPNLPKIKDQHLYKGLSIHSTQYQNAQLLAEQGVKSVAVIGSANTGFDVIEDFHNASIDTTMIARSPTYIMPLSYICDRRTFGVYDYVPQEVGDRKLLGMPTGVGGEIIQRLYAHLASQEPDRYKRLEKAGFPVIDSAHPSASLLKNLVEYGGGHYVDIGGTDLIADGKVAVRGMVEPIAYTETGLRLSDNSVLNADAVIWCTGFSDRNVRDTAQEILGSEKLARDGEEDVWGPKDIAGRLDATWGVNAEGEIRGMAMRHLRMENYWVIGGGFANQRWWSRTIAQQIKMELEGCLPPAYRDTPVVD